MVLSLFKCLYDSVSAITSNLIHVILAMIYIGDAIRSILFYEILQQFWRKFSWKKWKKYVYLFVGSPLYLSLSSHLPIVLSCIGYIQKLESPFNADLVRLVVITTMRYSIWSPNILCVNKQCYLFICRRKFWKKFQKKHIQIDKKGPHSVRKHVSRTVERAKPEQTGWVRLGLGSGSY